MTKQTLYKKLRLVAKLNDIKLRIMQKRTEIAGGAHPPTSRVYLYIPPHYTLDDIVSVFCHELSHILDWRDGLFKDFLKNNPSDTAINKLAWKTEIHADWRGKKLLKQYFPNFKYTKGYKKDDKEWLLDYYLEE